MDILLISYLYGRKTVQDHVVQMNELKAKDALSAEQLSDALYFDINADDFKPTSAIKRLAEGIKINKKKMADIIKKGIKKVNTISKLVYYDGYNQLLSTLVKTQEVGESIKSWVDRIGKKSILKNIGLDKDDPSYLLTVYRTNQTSAFTAGRYTESMENEFVEYLEYIAINDNVTTPQCAALDGMIRKKTDKVWDWATPPLHFNCRSDISALTKDSLEIQGLKETKKMPLAEVDGKKYNPKSLIDESFLKNPAKNDDWLKPSKGMIKRLKKYEK